MKPELTDEELLRELGVKEGEKAPGVDGVVTGASRQPVQGGDLEISPGVYVRPPKQDFRRELSDDEVARVDPLAGYEPNDLERLILGQKPRKKLDFWGTADDVIQSMGSGIAEGTAGLVGMGGDLRNLAHNMAEWGREKGINTGLDQWMYDNIPGLKWVGERILGPTTQQVDEAVTSVTGPYYQPKTTAGEYANTIGEFAPNALGGGSGTARTLSVVVPGVLSEGAGQLTEGSPIEPWARLAGGTVGGLAVSMRRSPQSATEVLTERFRPNGQEFMQRYQAFREAGIQPTLVDLMDESGRGVVRAAASRQTPARQAAQDFADTRALNLPDRMSRQARRTISPDPRTPDQIRTELTDARRVQADADFGAVRNERVPLTDDAVMALRTDDGRQAIRAAAARSLRSLDPDERNIGAELNRLADEVLDAPGEVRVSVGQAQSISEALFDSAEVAQRQGRNFDAMSLRRLANSVRGTASESVPGYRQALDNYAAGSRLIEATDLGEQFMLRNTDEFVEGVGRLSPEERQMALASARRAVERAAGENPASAPGVARRLANAPEQQARNRALLGDKANAMQDAMRLEAEAVENARQVAPRTGSQTQLRDQDAQQLRGVYQAITNPKGAIVDAILNRLKTRGMSDEQARQLVEMAIDPQQTEAALAVVRRIDPGYAKIMEAQVKRLVAGTTAISSQDR